MSYVSNGSWDGSYQSNGQPSYITWETTWVYDYSYSAPAEPSYYSYDVQVPYQYYKDVEVTVDYPGRVIAQSVVLPRAGWVTQVGLYYTQIGPSGSVDVFLTRCTDGKPDPTKVVSKVTLLQADMKKYPLETIVQVPPCIFPAGERIGIIEITQGAHFAALGDGGFTEGTLFLGSDGAYLQGDLTKDRKLKIYMAEFKAPRTEVSLQTAELVGGIGELMFSTEIPKLQGASLVFEANIGGVWEPLNGDNLGKLSGQPNLIPLRAVFIGTKDIQCGLQLGTNRVTVSRAALTSTIVSTAITTPAKRYFQVDIQVDRWDAVKNTVTCQLLTGGGYATVTNPSVSTVLDGDQPGFKKLRFTFDVGSTVTSYKVKDVLNRASDGPVPRRLDRISIATG